MLMPRNPLPATVNTARVVSIHPMLRWWFMLVLALAVMAAATAAQARATPESFADLAERLLPSVVNISTTQLRTAARRGPEIPQLPPGSPFEDFFKEFFDRQRPNSPPRKTASLGSGFIIDAAGYVVTNNHVIADADEITVILQDDTRLEAKLIGRDAKTDLALLKVTTKHPLTAVNWGGSDKMRVGDWVLAIGNPFGLGGSVSAGIISARKRDINAGPYDDFIQTDAAINRGNSGGPLFNMAGDVIGVNTAIISPQGGSVGVGFSIPSVLARSVIAQLREFGHTKRGWLGVRIQTVTDEIAESIGLDKARGALIAKVNEKGPASRGGIRQGDVILKFDGKNVHSMRRLPRIVAETKVGTKVEVEVWRKNRKQIFHVTLGELEKAEKAQKASLSTKKGGKGSKGPSSKGTKAETLGLTLSTVNPDLRKRFGISRKTEGVVVVKVDPGGSAAGKGIAPGDVIVEAGQDKVTSPAQIQAKVRAAKKAGRKSVLLLVKRKEDLRFIALKIGKG